jgi:hypothetical protein
MIAAAQFLSVEMRLLRSVSEDVLLTVVDVAVPVAEEADEGDVEVFADLYGEAGGSADGSDHGDAAHECFLHELEAGASGEQEQCVAEGCAVGEKFSAEELVDGVVTAYVFAYDEQIAGGVEECGTVDSSRLSEEGLGFAETVREYFFCVVGRLSGARAEKLCRRCRSWRWCRSYALDWRG